MRAFSPECLLPALAALPFARCYWVAYSGGLDSEVLLHALAALRRHLKAEIHALHMDHGLQPDSPAWVSHCRRSCARLGVALTVRRLELTPVRGESLEALARDARYGVMSGMLEEGDLLLTGQHRDDQAETLLLALLRGSGLKGLSAMPVSAPLGRGYLVRPLLAFGRADLLVYARAHGLTWVEDPSNADLAFDRNFIRRRVLPLLAERWPACSVTLARTADHCAEAQRLIEGFAEQALKEVGDRASGTLSIPRLRACERSLAKVVLRRWIEGSGLPPPDSRHLKRILDEVLAARVDGAPLVAWAGCEVRRYRDDLFAMAPLPRRPGSQTLGWRQGALELPGGLGRLVLTDPSGHTLDPILLTDRGLSVRFGVTGLSCLPNSRARHRSLKKLFQEAGMPPWLRPYVPLIFIEDALVAVGDLWVCVDALDAEGRTFGVVWDGGLRDHPGFPTRLA